MCYEKNSFLPTMPSTIQTTAKFNEYTEQISGFGGDYPAKVPSLENTLTTSCEMELLL